MIVGRSSARTTVPDAPGALPLVGHAIAVLRDPLRFLASLPIAGDLVRIRIGPYPALVVCEPQLTSQVLADDRTFDKGGPLFDRAREFVGDGLATCAHHQHRRPRRVLQPLFHPARLPRFADAMSEQIAAVTRSWRNNQVLDVHAEMAALTSNILFATMFSGGASPADRRRMLDDISTLFTGIYRRTLMPSPLRRLPMPGNHGYDHARDRLRAAVTRFLADRRRHDAGDDLLSHLLSTQDNPTGGGLSDTEISDHVLTFILAGSETPACTVAWALHLLARHPTIARQQRREVDTVLHGDTATLEHLPALELTGRVITETLRLYPPVWVATRLTTVDTHLGGQHIPAGTTIVFSPYLIHHRPDSYPDPERFHPDRWDTEGGGVRVRRADFIPFAGGARKCIGDQFGTIEAVLALASITARWRFVPLPRERVRPAAAALLAPRGLWMRAQRRDPSHPHREQRSRHA